MLVDLYFAILRDDSDAGHDVLPHCVRLHESPAVTAFRHLHSGMLLLHVSQELQPGQQSRAALSHQTGTGVVGLLQMLEQVVLHLQQLVAVIAFVCLLVQMLEADVLHQRVDGQRSLITVLALVNLLVTKVIQVRVTDLVAGDVDLEFREGHERVVALITMTGSQIDAAPVNVFQLVVDPRRGFAHPFGPFWIFRCLNVQ